MTPVMLQVLLHHYYMAEQYPYPPDRAQHSTSVERAHSRLHSLGLLEPSGTNPSGHTCSEKGKVYVRMLCDLPLPVQKWVEP